MYLSSYILHHRHVVQLSVCGLVVLVYQVRLLGQLARLRWQVCDVDKVLVQT